jgi:predicted enzyme related to lactoylglutathione lyase
VTVEAPIFIHYVYDMARAIGFYRSVFNVELDEHTPGWSTLRFPGFHLALHILGPGHEEEAPIPHAGLNLQVDDLVVFQQKIEEAGGRMTELREPVPHVPVRLGSFVDTEGNGFELRQPAPVT